MDGRTLAAVNQWPQGLGKVRDLRPGMRRIGLGAQHEDAQRHAGRTEGHGDAYDMHPRHSVDLPMASCDQVRNKTRTNPTPSADINMFSRPSQSLSACGWGAA